MAKNVPGYCSELAEACEILDVSLDKLVLIKDVRKALKKKVLEIQSRELLKRMALSSKMDRVIFSGFSFDGLMMNYLNELSFEEARAIFMTRYRMWPTKVNFQGRWGENVDCNVCGIEDNDEHVFTCPGYADIVQGKLRIEMFWDEEVLKNTELLKMAAQMVIKVINRMKSLQKM